jgi:hypothetical protein
VPDFADDGDVGGHAQEARDEAAQVDLAPVGAGVTGLHRRHVGQGQVGLEYFLGHDDPQAGSSSAAQQDRRVVFPQPGEPEKTIDSRARTQARRKPATRVSSVSRSTSSSRER